MKKENWDQTIQFSKGTWHPKIGKERVHSKSVRFTNVVLARENSGKDHMSRPCTNKDAPTEKHGFWRKYLQAQECGQNNVPFSQFNPRYTVARLLGFCLKSSRYIVVDFNGRYRMVRTIKRANADDRWKVVSPSDPFSAADLESTSAEFTCSRELGRKSIPLHNNWRGVRLMLSRQIQIVIQFRGGCTSCRVTSRRTGRQIAVRVAEH